LELLHPVEYKEDQTFTIGKGNVLQDGDDITLIASGFVMVPEALKAAELLAEEGIKAAVIDMHTIKPLDNDLVIEYAKKTRAIVTCENHQVTGGLGGAVAELLSEECPTYLGRIGSKDRFGQVGTLEFLMEDYKLTAKDIVKSAHEVLSKKKGNK
jgi:transketolase